MHYSVGVLLIKLIVVPVLIGLVTLAGRRWGPGIAGLLVGLPWTSGPVLIFLAAERGAWFAAEAAVGIVAGVLALAAFCVAYTRAAIRMRWLTCSLIGGIAYLTMVLLVLGITVALPIIFALVCVVLVLASKTMPRTTAADDRRPTTRWDIPLRMICATAVVVALTGFAEMLGPQLAGLLAPFPVYASILAVFAHRESGGGAAILTLHGVVHGSFSFALFFLVAAISMEPLGVSVSILTASASALSLHFVLAEAYRGFAACRPTSHSV